jgi:hypothetical protein
MAQPDSSVTSLTRGPIVALPWDSSKHSNSSTLHIIEGAWVDCQARLMERIGGRREKKTEKKPKN